MNAVQGQIELIEPVGELKAECLSMLEEHLRLGENDYNHELAQTVFSVLD